MERNNPTNNINNKNNPFNGPPEHTQYRCPKDDRSYQANESTANDEVDPEGLLDICNLWDDSTHGDSVSQSNVWDDTRMVDETDSQWTDSIDDEEQDVSIEEVVEEKFQDEDNGMDVDEIVEDEEDVGFGRATTKPILNMIMDRKWRFRRLEWFRKKNRFTTISVSFALVILDNGDSNDNTRDGRMYEVE